MRITVELECNAKTCGKCKLVVNCETREGAVCGLFLKYLDEGKKDYLRLPECLSAYKAHD